MSIYGATCGYFEYSHSRRGTLLPYITDLKRKTPSNILRNLFFCTKDNNDNRARARYPQGSPIDNRGGVSSRRMGSVGTVRREFVVFSDRN